MKEIMHKAFWDYLEDQLKADPPTYTHAIKLLAEIKEVPCGEAFNRRNQQFICRVFGRRPAAELQLYPFSF